MVPYDKSDNAFKAVEMGVKLTKENPNALMEIVMVVPPVADAFNTASYYTSFSSTEPVAMNVENLQAIRNNAFNKEIEQIQDLVKVAVADVVDQVEITVIPGVSPVDDIVAYSKDGEFDVIVMGCRGLGAIRGVLGSVSYGVLRASSAPVLIVK